jgi:diphthamide biosynthesis protein 7
MGFTSIQSHPTLDHILAVGSYDCTTRIFDKRAMRRPVLQHILGGGVWRLKWDTTDPSLLISASMHSGFHILSLNGTITFFLFLLF